MISEPFSLLAPPQTELIKLDGAWRLISAHKAEGVELGYPDLAFDDSLWDTAQLPHLRHSTAEQDTLWYRYKFDLSALVPLQTLLPTQRLILRFGGAFYRTHVWFNGIDLGAHEGYFQPFGFDITDQVRAGINVIAVRCRFPVEAGSFKRKTAVAGVFADWDCKPYPSAFYPNLPAPTQWSVPIGLWQPVSLMKCSAVLVETFNVFPQVAALTKGGVNGKAELKIVFALRNLTAESQNVCAQVNIVPHAKLPLADEAVSSDELNILLAPYEVRQVEFMRTLPNARLWFPHTHGEPFLYQAQLKLEAASTPEKGEIGEVASADEVVRVFGIRSIEALIESNRWEWRLNGRRIFPKGSNYISDFYLDRVSADSLQRDIVLAREANLDLLRVHAHIAPLDFYKLCDELGVMVMCDFPLIWTYAFNLSSTEERAFRESVQRQVAEMIHLLGSHPSIILWSMHNEPPWTPDGSFLGGDLHEAKTNQQLDRESVEIARSLDVTRPVIAASGESDQHLYHGWYTGHWRDNRDLHPRFPTEFGVQALPNLASPFWATVNQHWPIEADDLSWAHSGYQSVFWASPGVGSPAQFSSLADYVQQSQAYQAFFIRYTIDQWRRQKFNPVGGYIHFLFTDGWPAITWSVLDYYRLPKAGYAALKEASSAVRICLDVQSNFNVENGFHIVYRRGEVLKCDLYLVNDDYRIEGKVEVRWWLARHDNFIQKWLNVLRSVFAQRIALALPAADEGARQVASLEIPLRGDGVYTLEARVGRGGRLLNQNQLNFRVGHAKARAKAARQVPAVLINKVYQVKSLRHTEEGFALTLRNPAMPVLLERVQDLRVDGVLLEAAQVEIIRGGVSRWATTISPQAPLEIPSNELFTVLVHNQILTAGIHELELTVQLLGFGEIAAKIKDKLV